MAKISLERLTDIDGFVAAALIDTESGLALATQGGVWQLGAHVRRAGRRPLRRRRLEMVVALLFRCAGHAGHQRPSRGAG